jgi:hypothetical protein
VENRGPGGSAEPVEVLLCLAAPDDPDVLTVVGDEFRKIFAGNQHLDTLFLSDAQQLEVAKVAAPFYSAG